MHYNRRQPTTYSLQSRNGFTIIEILITVFIIGTIVTGVFGLFVLSLRISSESELRIIGVSLANERMEMIRNLPYANVGTIDGEPSGSIPHIEQVTRSGALYTITTTIQYIDDPYDGLAPEPPEEQERVTLCHKPGTNDEKTITVDASALDAHLGHGDYTGECGSDGQATPLDGDLFPNDYKHVLVEVSWQSHYDIRPVTLATFVVPPGMEGGQPKGIFDILVRDTEGDGVPFANVAIFKDGSLVGNYTTNEEEGRVVITDMEEEEDAYEIVVTKEGYTSAQTYDATSTFIPHPHYSHLSLMVREITHATFTIDAPSNLTIRTVNEEGNAIGNIEYTLRSTSTIGVDQNNALVPAVEDSRSTNASGEGVHPNITWGSYRLNLETSGYSIKETSEFLPIAVQPGQSLTVDVVLVDRDPGEHTFHVSVADPLREPINGADVRLVGNGYDESLATEPAGQVLFRALPQAGEYALEVSAAGHVSTSGTVYTDRNNRVFIVLSNSE